MNVTVTPAAEGVIETFPATTVDYDGASTADQVAVFDRGPNERRYPLADYWIHIAE